MKQAISDWFIIFCLVVAFVVLSIPLLIYVKASKGFVKKLWREEMEEQERALRSFQ